MFVFLRNSNSIKLKILDIFEPKLGKLISKLKLKLEKLIFLELDMHSNAKFSNSMKLTKLAKNPSKSSPFDFDAPKKPLKLGLFSKRIF